MKISINNMYLVNELCFYEGRTSVKYMDNIDLMQHIRHFKGDINPIDHYKVQLEIGAEYQKILSVDVHMDSVYLQFPSKNFKFPFALLRDNPNMLIAVIKKSAITTKVPDEKIKVSFTADGYDTLISTGIDKAKERDEAGVISSEDAENIVDSLGHSHLVYPHNHGYPFMRPAMPSFENGGMVDISQSLPNFVPSGTYPETEPVFKSREEALKNYFNEGEQTKDAPPPPHEPIPVVEFGDDQSVRREFLYTRIEGGQEIESIGITDWCTEAEAIDDWIKTNTENFKKFLGDPEIRDTNDIPRDCLKYQRSY